MPELISTVQPAEEPTIELFISWKNCGLQSAHSGYFYLGVTQLTEVTHAGAEMKIEEEGMTEQLGTDLNLSCPSWVRGSRIVWNEGVKLNLGKQSKEEKGVLVFFWVLFVFLKTDLGIKWQ